MKNTRGQFFQTDPECFYCLQQLKIMNRGLQICLADTLDGQANGILAGIKYAILAGAVVLELQHHIAVVQLINILGLTLVYLFHLKKASR